MSFIPPSPVDEKNNISFNRQEGVTIPFSETDGSGNVINLSALPRTFILGNRDLVIYPPVDPNNAAGRVIYLSVAQLRAVSSQGLSFVLLDEQSSPPVALWEGFIYERNTFL